MRKKILAAALAALIMCAASCGGETPATAAATKAAEEAPADPVKSYTASDITAAVVAEMPIKSAVEKGADDLEFYFGSLDTENVLDCSYYMCASGAYADEVAVIRFNSAENADNALSEIKARMDKQLSSWKDYKPEEADKFSGAVAKTHGEYVVYLVTSDNGRAEEIADSMLNGAQ